MADADIVVQNQRGRGGARTRRGRGGRGGRGGGRGGGNAEERTRSKSSGSLPPDLKSAQIVRVKGDSRPNRVARAVSSMAKEDERSVVVCAIGAVSINQAVKSVIMARQNLQEDGMDFLVKARRLPTVGRDAIALECVKTTSVNNEKNDAEILRLSSESKPDKVAGAVAMRVRDGQEPVVMGVGAEVVKLMVKTVAIASDYLKEEGIVLTFRPVYEEADLKSGRGVVVRLDISVSKTAAA